MINGIISAEVLIKNGRVIWS